METLNVKSIKFDGYKIELSENTQGKPVARLSKFMTAGPFKGNYKHLKGFYFSTEERRKEWITEKMTNIKANIASEKKAKEELAEVKKNFVNPYVVGDIYHCSWGYDQTNVDFYQILEVKKKSVVIQRIGSKMGEPRNGYSSMSGFVVPDPEVKRGDPETKIVQVRNWGGKISYHLKMEFGVLIKYTDGDKGTYCSWYA